MDAIGIDLGTTNSCVGILKNGQVEIVANEEGKRVTPSVVSLTAESGWLVGNAAKEEMNKNVKNTVYDAKRMLGKAFFHPDIQKLMENWQFELVDKEGLPSIKLCLEGVPSEYIWPWEVSAMVLDKMRSIAERGLEQRQVKLAVIGVPANFQDAQKKETMKAAEKVGFQKVKFITEPSAAAIAYGFDHQKFDGYRLLVYDFGGGTFDVTIIQANKGEFTQLATFGDDIGGRDIDKLLFDWCIMQIKKEFGKDIKAEPRRTKYEQKLMVECNKIKHDLSTMKTTELKMYSFGERGKAIKISREQLNQCCFGLIQETILLTRQALLNAGLEPKQIDSVLLVGGSTRIPLVREKLSEIFPTIEKFNEKVNPDHAVAYGATVLAAQYAGIATRADVQIRLKEIVPLSIGVDSNKGQFLRLIPRDTPIPSETITEQLWTSTNNQQGMTIEFYQGEHEMSADNIRINQFVLMDKLKGAAGQVAVKLIVRVNENGLLEATASYNGEPISATFDYNVARMNKSTVEKMLKRAALAADEERAKKSRIDARNELELALEEAIYELNKKKGHIRDWMAEVCEETEEWLQKHKNEESISEAVYKKKLKDFRKELNSGKFE